MRIRETTLPGVLIVEPHVFEDVRGHFLEIYQDKRYAAQSIAEQFVQDNVSFSKKGVLRGLHYQLHNPQAKLVMVLEGGIFDVSVDIRRGSPTFGKWFGTVLSSRDYQQVYIPQGFAHGFCVLSETAKIIYKCTDYYTPSDERGIIWSDPTLGIEWPIAAPLLSEKDAAFPAINAIAPAELPVFKKARN